jgi:hypothetical protein
MRAVIRNSKLSLISLIVGTYYVPGTALFAGESSHPFSNSIYISAVMFISFQSNYMILFPFK